MRDGIRFEQIHLISLIGGHVRRSIVERAEIALLARACLELVPISVIPLQLLSLSQLGLTFYR